MTLLKILIKSRKLLTKILISRKNLQITSQKLFRLICLQTFQSRVVTLLRKGTGFTGWGGGGEGGGGGASEERVISNIFTNWGGLNLFC